MLRRGAYACAAAFLPEPSALVLLILVVALVALLVVLLILIVVLVLVVVLIALLVVVLVVHLCVLLSGMVRRYCVRLRRTLCKNKKIKNNA